MKKITALKVQKRNSNRINIYLDNEFAFGLSRIVAAWLSVGQELSEEKIEALKIEDASEVALQKAIQYIQYRPRTEAEVEKKLLQQDYAEATIRGVIERLKRNHLLNDLSYAVQWVENRCTFHPRSHRVIRMELRQKGISDNVIDEALAKAVEEEDLAYAAGLPKVRRFAALEWFDFRKKMSAYLGRKGFSYGVISPVVEKLWNELKSGEDSGEPGEPIGLNGLF